MASVQMFIDIVKSVEDTDYKSVKGYFGAAHVDHIKGLLEDVYGCEDLQLKKYKRRGEDVEPVSEDELMMLLGQGGVDGGMIDVVEHNVLLEEILLLDPDVESRYLKSMGFDDAEIDAVRVMVQDRAARELTKRLQEEERVRAKLLIADILRQKPDATVDFLVDAMGFDRDLSIEVIDAMARFQEQRRAGARGMRAFVILDRASGRSMAVLPLLPGMLPEQMGPSSQAEQEEEGESPLSEQQLAEARARSVQQRRKAKRDYKEQQSQLRRERQEDQSARAAALRQIGANKLERRAERQHAQARSTDDRSSNPGADVLVGQDGDRITRAEMRRRRVNRFAPKGPSRERLAEDAQARKVEEVKEFAREVIARGVDEVRAMERAKLRLLELEDERRKQDQVKVKKAQLLAIKVFKDNRGLERSLREKKLLLKAITLRLVKLRQLSDDQIKQAISPIVEHINIAVEQERVARDRVPRGRRGMRRRGRSRGARGRNASGSKEGSHRDGF